jgi:predicted aldo/keto reductase-like oxidoreductase
MRYKRLRGTNLELSTISYGGLALFFRPEDEALKLINVALDEGVNYIDCDEGGNQFVPNLVYEDTRKKLGRVLKARRGQCQVGIKTMFAKKDEVARDIDKALEYVFKGTSREVIDIFHFAHVDVDEKLDLLLSPQGGLAAAEEAREAGKLDYILVASHNPRVLMRALKSGRFDVAEFPFTIMEQEYLEEVIPYCSANNIGTIVMKPIGGGQLGDFANLSLRWIMQHDVDVIIPGMKSLKELKENLRAGHTYIPLSSEEFKALETYARKVGQEYCHRCGYCLPCPQGIHIVSQVDVYKTNLFTVEEKQALYRQIKEKGSKTASDCAACGQCVEKCPFKIPIPEIMEKSRALLDVT